MTARSIRATNARSLTLTSVLRHKIKYFTGVLRKQGTGHLKGCGKVKEENSAHRFRLEKINIAKKWAQRNKKRRLPRETFNSIRRKKRSFPLPVFCGQWCWSYVGLNCSSIHELSSHSTILLGYPHEILFNVPIYVRIPAPSRACWKFHVAMNHCSFWQRPLNLELFRAADAIVRICYQKLKFLVLLKLGFFTLS